jgi:hypothetical protein
MEDWLEFMFGRADALVQRAASRPRLPRPAAVRSYHAQLHRAALHAIAMQAVGRANTVTARYLEANVMTVGSPRAGGTAAVTPLLPEESLGPGLSSRLRTGSQSSGCPSTSSALPRTE